MSGGLMGGINDGLSLLWKLLVLVFVIFLAMQLASTFIPGIDFNNINNWKIIKTFENNFDDLTKCYKWYILRKI